MTRPRSAFLARILAAALAAVSAVQGALWVSPGGDDRNPGSEEQPLRTLERARDVVRGLNRDMADDITVFLSGTLSLAQPLRLGPEDSGTNGFSVVYTAAPGEHPVLTGAIAVTGWSAADRTRNLWTAPVPDGLAGRCDLYIDGAPPIQAGNAFELLGRPGVWCLDRPTHRFYYTPRPGENMVTADVEAACAPSLVVAGGSAAKPLTGIIFKGIRFEYTRIVPEMNFLPSALMVSGASDIQFLEDEFLHMGTPALSLGPRVAGATVEGCLFGDIAGSALGIADAARVRVFACRFSYTCTVNHNAAAIEVDRSEDVEVSRCQIDHFPGVGIALAGDKPGAVRTQMNKVAAPMIESSHGGADLIGSGIPADYRSLLDVQLFAPAFPQPPTTVSALAGDAIAIVTWDPPCLDGGSPVSGYTVVSSTGMKASVSAGDFRERGYALVPGLANDQPVSFTVSAENDLGASLPSGPSAPVVPVRPWSLRPPPPPASVTVTAGDGASRIVITPSSANGGSPVVSYRLRTLPDGPQADIEGRDVIRSDPAHPITRTLERFDPVRGSGVAVTATNAAGEGKPAIIRWP